jgi:hypothetical protein
VSFGRNDLIEGGKRAINGGLAARRELSRVGNEPGKRKRSNSIGIKAAARNDRGRAAYKIGAHQELRLMNIPFA